MFHHTLDNSTILKEKCEGKEQTCQILLPCQTVMDFFLELTFYNVLYLVTGLRKSKFLPLHNYWIYSPFTCSRPYSTILYMQIAMLMATPENVLFKVFDNQIQSTF